MGLDIPTHQGCAAGLLPGAHVGHVFLGSHTLRGEHSPRRQAQGAALDGIFVGRGTAEGDAGLFAFRRPRA
jgi:hypothetical protein